MMEKGLLASWVESHDVMAHEVSSLLSLDTLLPNIYSTLGRA